MNYVIGTGFHDHPERHHRDFYQELFHRWYTNTLAGSDAQIFCLATGGCKPPELGQRTFLIDGDIGSIGHIVKDKKPHALCGGQMAILTLALLAYNDERDFIYKEQDCFAFGDWPKQMYADLGDGGMVHGGRLKRDPNFCGLSLMLVRHSFIPDFVAWHLAYPKPDKMWLMEGTQIKMAEKFPRQVRQLSFGYDRDRPWRDTDPVWYVQTHDPDEIAALRDKGLL